MTSPRPDAVFAHFDPDGLIAEHVRRTVELLIAATSRLIVVSAASLTTESRAWFEARATLATRPNTGHDFAGYRDGLALLGVPARGVLLVNDSIVPLARELEPLIDRMSDRGADFWGITPGYGFAPHLQSYFLGFTPTVVQSPAWREFWQDAGSAQSREDAILNGEVALSQTLLGAGFRMDAWFRPSTVELLRGATRAHSDELVRALADRRPRRVAGWMRRLPGRARHPEWNPAVALADVSLHRPARLPFVKISALRDDAYRLGSAALLTAFERRRPASFAGVRDYLERTDPVYGRRWADAVQRRTGIVRYRVR